MGNYVIVDIEWIEKGTFVNPTQISAVKVNSDWKGLSHFSERIKPRSEHFHIWKHVAYTGGTASSFLSARSAFHVFEDFEGWLGKDDVILWWFSTGKETYSALMKSIHKHNPLQKQLVLRDYLDSFLSGKRYNKWNAFDIAKQLKLSLQGKAHDSFADVLTVKAVLAAIDFPQELLKEPPAEVKGADAFIPMPYLRYVYDRRANVLHIAGCREIGGSTVFTNNLSRYIKKKVPPCPICMKKEYREQRRKLCRDSISRMQCKFIYSPHSSVFHKTGCRRLGAVVQALGCCKYATAIKTGRTPCKICNPTVADEQKKKPENKKRSKPLQPGHDIANGSKSNTEKAIIRFKQAKKERDAVDFKTVKTTEERRDILTLTGTVYGFFVGKGYDNFHIKSCPRLKALSGITGFKTYGEAISAGFTPCKTCKPTKKFNVNLSIPMTSRERSDEKVLDLYTYCAAYGYPCSQDEEYFYVKTPVGKWKINLTSKPVRLRHINLVANGDKDEYHDQPRIFLSMTDAILYIRKHDNSLLNKA